MLDQEKYILKIIAVAALMALSFATTAIAEEALNGGSLFSAQSSQNSVHNSSLGFTAIVSIRPTEYYGYEFQLGMFGESGPFKQNALVDGAVVGLLPLGDSGFRVYGKAGVADVFSQASNVSANNLGFTYGAGVEFKKNKTALRVGFQHYSVGNDSLSPSLSTNLIGLSVLTSKE